MRKKVITNKLLCDIQNINLPILHICTSETLHNSLITKYIKITYLFLRYYYPCGLIIFLYK